MDEYIEVRIDVFEHTGQRARLRKNLTVNDLIAEILREFDDITADSPEKYAIYLKGFDRPLTSGNTLTELDIQPQDELVFEYVRRTIRQMLDDRNYATLREDTTGKEFDIQWQPAVIGRPSTDVDHNIILAVNVTLLPNGKTISRRHAQITFSEGRYFIEPLANENPVLLNGRELALNSRREIKHGDKLALGRHKLAMTFMTQSQRDSRPLVREPVPSSMSQPAPMPASRPVPSEPLPSRPHINEPDATNILATPSLVIEASAEPGRVGQRLEMIAFPFIVGRSLEILASENDVSRRHAEITRDAGGRYFIMDLQSTNGVTINGQMIPPNAPHLITNGARIGLGSVLVMRFDA